MKTYLLLVIIAIIEFSCGQTQINNKKTISKNEKNPILLKQFYPNGILKATIEANADSVQNGMTVWYDSTGKKSTEEFFLNGKRNGILTAFYENGKTHYEEEYLNDKMVKSKWYDVDGSILSLNPLDIMKIGKMMVVISNGKRDYFIKGKVDTINIYAAGLPPYNYVVSVNNATIRSVDKFKYKIVQIKNPKSIKILLQTRLYSNDTVTNISLDSTEIMVKDISRL
ncbi:MAG: hypothetical protein V4511_00945 [Bacteroidota bacterium]